MRPDTNLATTIETMQRRAEADLLAAAGDTSLCAIGKSGRSYPAVKYHEGRAAAFAALKLVVVRGEGSSLDVVAKERERWLGFRRLAERDASWQGYVQGGLDALDRVQALLDDNPAEQAPQS